MIKGTLTVLVKRPFTGILVLALGMATVLMSAYDIVQTLSGSYPVSVEYWMIFSRATQFHPILYAGCSFLSLSVFCGEWRSGAWKYKEVRIGKKRYVRDSVMLHWLCSFFVSLVANLVCTAVLVVLGSLNGVPLRDAKNPEFLIVGSLPIDWLMRFMMQALACGFWSMLGFLVAQLQNDLFLALAVPAAAYMGLNFLSMKMLPMPFKTGFGNMEMLVYPEHQVQRFFLFSAFLGLLTALAGSAAADLLKKRVEYERIS